MSFWQNVADELEYNGMSRKELAKEAGFPDSYISKGIARGSVPAADLAVRISHALDVPLEQLLGMDDGLSATSAGTMMHQIKLYEKYREVIGILESVPAKKRKGIESILAECARLAKEASS